MPEDNLPGHDSRLPPAIRWAPIGTLTIYHITEQELDQIERGESDSIYFSFAVFLVSTGLSFLTTLLTADIKSQRLFNVFFILTLFGLASGSLLFLVWLRIRRAAPRITKLIRSRKPLGNAPGG